MRKSILTAALLFTVIAVSASAVQITTIGSITGTQYASNGTDGYNVAGLSDDGNLVACSSDTAARFYNVSTGTWSSSLGATSFLHGLGVWAGDGTYSVFLNVGSKASAANPLVSRVGRTTSSGAPFSGLGYLKPNPTTGGNVIVPSAFNSVSIDYATGNGWVVGHANNAGFRGKGMAHRITAGNLAVGSGASTWEQLLGDSTTNGGLNGVSNAGVGVGLSNTLGPILADLNNNTAGSIKDIVAYAGADAAGGAATGVSANATVNGSVSGTGFVGGFFKSGGWRHGFLLDLASGDDGVATELFPIDGVYGGAGEETEVFDVSNNGIAVGYDLAGGVKTAAVWLPGSTQAVSLVSIMNETLPSDGSISGLSAIVSITAEPNANGAYTVAGQAIMSDFTSRAFVATILPEPATLAFLALGGLVMLRRRR